MDACRLMLSSFSYILLFLMFIYKGITTGHRGSREGVKFKYLFPKHFRDLTSEVKFMVYKLASNLTTHSNVIGFTQIKKMKFYQIRKQFCNGYKNKNFRTPSSFK